MEILVFPLFYLVGNKWYIYLVYSYLQGFSKFNYLAFLRGSGFSHMVLSELVCLVIFCNFVL